ncbi:MAG: hypothetical protein QW815_08355 [Nitrososphaerota archaeon]
MEREALSLHSGPLFLSNEWIRKAVGLIERAKANDESIRRLTSEFSLSVAYVIDRLPDELKGLYDSDRIIIYIKLDRGLIKEFDIGKELPKDQDADFIVESSYDVARKIFTNEVNVGTAFVRRYIRVRPFYKLYANPSFTAKSLITMNVLLQVMGKVPTIFP